MRYSISWQVWLSKSDLELTSTELVSACSYDVADWFFSVSLADATCAGAPLARGANEDVLRCGSLENFVRMCEHKHRSLEAGLLARFYGLEMCTTPTDRERQAIESIYAMTPVCSGCKHKVPELCNVTSGTVFCRECAV